MDFPVFNYKIIERVNDKEYCSSNGTLNFVPRIGEKINIGHMVVVKDIEYDFTQTDGRGLDVKIYADAIEH